MSNPPESEYKELRQGPGVRWSLFTKTGFGDRHESGYTIDNLDKKNIIDAESLFEKIFILSRIALEKNEARCMDSENDRLQCCQDIAKSVHRFLVKESAK